ncbi:MAG: hypothetical protein IKV94_04025 [Clostridia bacterium]|nr:hypothetical protein [Clostridia bacterium]
MFFVKKPDNYEYIAPLDLLDTLTVEEGNREVMATFNNQELVKEEDKYFLGSIVDPSKCKEISRDAAYELLKIQEQQKMMPKSNIYLD